jgi:hypothetical protein
VASRERINRVARNEARFREVNATLHDGLAAADLAPDERAAFVCECGDADCHELVKLPIDRYEAARAHGDRFVVRPGHEILEAERVVEGGETWIVVEKLDRADAIDIVEGS